MGDALAGRVVLITGSSRGIGAEVAVKAATEGAVVAIHYRSGADAAAATLDRVRACGAEAESFAADVADGPQAEALVARVIERFGRIDGLVNNAGLTQVGPFLEIDPADWDAVIRTDLTAAFHTCRAALPSMVGRGSGSIVNVASRLGQMGVAQTAAYSAAKAGLIGLTRSLAREVARFRITVNCLCAGFVETAMTAGLSEKARAELVGAIPLGRAGRPEEIAAAAEWLCSDGAGYVTGTVLGVDGGLT
jgi:3-oxoacyl-[acyl-carrier protein] reductase